jgi:hypothetical protein
LETENVKDDSRNSLQNERLINGKRVSVNKIQEGDFFSLNNEHEAVNGPQ